MTVPPTKNEPIPELIFEFDDEPVQVPKSTPQNSGASSLKPAASAPIPIPKNPLQPANDRRPVQQLDLNDSL